MFQLASFNPRNIIACYAILFVLRVDGQQQSGNHHNSHHHHHHRHRHHSHEVNSNNDCRTSSGDTTDNENLLYTENVMCSGDVIYHENIDDSDVENEDINSPYRKCNNKNVFIFYKTLIIVRVIG